MKAKFITAPGILLVLFTVGIALCLVSWDFKQTNGQYPTGNNDTTPKVKLKEEKKVRDLDDVLSGWDENEFKQNMERAQREIHEAMKNIDKEKIKMEIEKAMRDVDMNKIQKEVAESMAKIDWDHIKKEMEMSTEMKEQMDKVKEEMKDLGPRMQKEMEKMKELNLDKMNIEMEKVREQMKELGPQMEKVRVDMEKTRSEIKEYTDFVDGLAKDGLINKKENYTIRYRNGELSVNGKSTGIEVTNKYRSFLDKHKTFTIEKSGEDFNIDVD